MDKPEHKIVTNKGEVLAVYDDHVTYPQLDEEYEPDLSSKALPSPPVANVNLDVPFVHQLWDTPNWFNGRWACGPTSTVMVTAFYGLLEPVTVQVSKPYPHTSQFSWYVCNDFTHEGRRFNTRAALPKKGEAEGFYGTAMGYVRAAGGWVAVAGSADKNGSRGILPILLTFLEPLGKSATVRAIDTMSARHSEEIIKNSLDKGNPVIISTRPKLNPTIDGHIIVIKGYYYDPKLDLYGWIVNDPYGFKSSGDIDLDGSDVVYLWSEMRPKYFYLIRG